MCFDEWGQCKDGMSEHMNAAMSHTEASMSGIIHKHHKDLGIRWKGNVVGHANDLHCIAKDGAVVVKDCAPCEFEQGKLINAKPFPKKQKAREVAFCHFYLGKASRENSLDEASIHRFAELGEFRVNHDQGFHELSHG